MEGKYYLLLGMSGFGDQDVAVAARPASEDEMIQTPRRGAADSFASTLNQIPDSHPVSTELRLGNWPPHLPSQQNSEWVKGSSWSRILSAQEVWEAYTNNTWGLNVMGNIQTRCLECVLCDNNDHKGAF